MASYLYPYAEIRAPNGIWLSSKKIQSYFTCALYICKKKKNTIKVSLLIWPQAKLPQVFEIWMPYL